MTLRRWVSRRRMGALAFAVALVCVAGGVRAQVPAGGGAAAGSQPSAAPAPGVDAKFDARVKTVSSRLRCPVCQGESIQDSPAELAGQMKQLVREQLASGRSEQQVMDYFTQKYGQWILLEPKAEGFNLLVYLLPMVFLLLGGGVIVMAVKKWSKPAGVAADRAPVFPLDETVP
jgi:cytochrome c-type biogenesis protein CcmH